MYLVCISCYISLEDGSGRMEVTILWNTYLSFLKNLYLISVNKIDFGLFYLPIQERSMEITTMCNTDILLLIFHNDLLIQLRNNLLIIAYCQYNNESRT